MYRFAIKGYRILGEPKFVITIAKNSLDSLVQWVSLCFIYFVQLDNVACRNYLIDKFLLISEKYHFDSTRKHCITLSNIIIKNLVLLKTPRSSREASLKVLKLS